MSDAIASEEEEGESKMSRMVNIFLLVPFMLILLHPSPSYCQDQKTFLPAILYLLNSKPLMEDTRKRAIERFGSQADAAVAILLSGNQGYSWREIVDAIEAGSLQEDGSIVGISPERAIAARKKLGYRDLSDKTYTPAEIRAAVENEKAFVLARIVLAICMGYSHDQIVEGLVVRKLLTQGLIECSQLEIDKGLCTHFKERTVLLPALKERRRLWENCWRDPILDPSAHPHPRGCWRDGSYWVTVEEAANGYKYTGDGGLYRHSGIIRGGTFGSWSGSLQDEPDYCCGNHGSIWLDMKDESTCRIRSTWWDPYGNLVKQTDWQDLTRVSCE